MPDIRIMATLRLKTNLNCGSCVAAVTPYLDAEPSVARWRVATDVPEKILTVEGDAPDEARVKAAVARAGFRVLERLDRTEPSVATPSREIPASTPADASAATYYPLILLLAFLLGVVGIVEWNAGAFDGAGFDGARAMRNFMGGFFVVFAFFKLLDPRGFADAYRMYDVVAARVPAYGYVYPFIELALGVAYLANFPSTPTNVAVIVVMAIGTLGVVRSLLRKQTIRCACLGTVFNLPMSTVTIVEDAGMLAMAVAMLVMG